MNWQTEGLSFVHLHPGTQPSILKKLKGKKGSPQPKL